MNLPAPLCHLLYAGSELNQEKQTCTFRAQGERKDSCKLLLNTVGVWWVSPEEEEEAGTGASLQPQQLTASSFPSPFSDLPGGESQRGGESCGNPLPGRQKTAHHYCHAKGLYPAYGESLIPAGPGKLSLP